VCYHGFRSNPLNSNLFYNLFDKDKKFNPHFEPSNNISFSNQIDINSPQKNQTCGIGTLCSPDPISSEEQTVSFSLNGVKYKLMLQCRVNPSKIKIPKNNKEIVIINSSEHIRPYGILIKEIV
jgi:hypothetical protein